MANTTSTEVGYGACIEYRTTDSTWELYSMIFGGSGSAFAERMKAARAWRYANKVSMWPVDPPRVMRDAYALVAAHMQTTYHGYGRLGQPVFYESGGSMVRSVEWSKRTTQDEFNLWFGLQLEHEMRRAAMKRPSGPHRDAQGVAIYVTDARGYNMDTLKMMGFARGARTFYGDSGLYVKPLHAFIMINMPAAMKKVLQCMTWALRGMAGNIHLIGEDEEEISRVLSAYINPNQIPRCYGGTCSLSNCSVAGVCIDPVPSGVLPTAYDTGLLNDTNKMVLPRVGGVAEVYIDKPTQAGGEGIDPLAVWNVFWTVTIPKNYAIEYSVEFEDFECRAGETVTSTKTISNHGEGNRMCREIKFVLKDAPDHVTLRFRRRKYMMANVLYVCTRSEIIAVPETTPESQRGTCGCFLGIKSCK